MSEWWDPPGQKRSQSGSKSWRHSLGKENGRGEVVAKPQNFGYLVIPVQVLRVNGEEVPAREWPARRMQYI
jgi:hypothetical protein